MLLTPRTVCLKLFNCYSVIKTWIKFTWSKITGKSPSKCSFLKTSCSVLISVPFSRNNFLSVSSAFSLKSTCGRERKSAAVWNKGDSNVEIRD